MGSLIRKEAVHISAPILKLASGNSASTTLSSSISDSATAAPLTSDTNFAAESGEGMVIMDEGQATEEIAYATGKSGASLTIPLANRGLEGSSAQAHASGATVKGILTAGMWNDLVTALTDNLLDKTAGTTKAGIALTKPVISGSVNTLTADSDAATITFDMAASNIHSVTLTDNRTLAVSNTTAGQAFILRIIQDGSGSHTVTWFSTIKWAGGSAPTLTTTASKIDAFGFLCTSTGNYDGYVIGQNI